MSLTTWLAYLGELSSGVTRSLTPVPQLQLYCDPRSTCSKKILLLLAEKGALERCTIHKVTISFDHTEDELTSRELPFPTPSCPRGRAPWKSCKIVVATSRERSSRSFRALLPRATPVPGASEASCPTPATSTVAPELPATDGDTTGGTGVFGTLAVNLGRKEQLKPEYVEKIHPFGKVPVLFAGDLRIYETSAIVQYLDTVLPGPRLLPAWPDAGALCQQWMSVHGCYFKPAMFPIYFERRLKLRYSTGAESDEGKVYEAVAKTNEVLDVLEKHLAGGGQGLRPYLACDHLTMADLYFLPELSIIADEVTDSLLARPLVYKWYEKLSALPSWVNNKDAWAENF